MEENQEEDFEDWINGRVSDSQFFRQGKFSTDNETEDPNNSEKTPEDTSSSNKNYGLKNNYILLATGLIPNRQYFSEAGRINGK